MARETGVVTKINGPSAVVKTRRLAACEGCSEKSTCHSLGGVREMEVEAHNPVNAAVGDTVTLEFPTRRMLQLSLLLYIFPIVALLIGAIIGDRAAANFGMDESVLSAVAGFAGFFLAMGALLAAEKKAKRSRRYQPTIIRARRATGPAAEKCELCH